MQEFSKEIKNCRLFCKINNQKLELTLISLDQDELFCSEFDNPSLPPTITQLCNTVQDVYSFLKEKVKYFKIIGPGELICYKYTGTAQKFISFRLQRQTLVNNDQCKLYISYLKKQLKKVQTSLKENLKLIKVQQSKIQILQAGNPMKSAETRYSKRNRLIYDQNYKQREENSSIQKKSKGRKEFIQPICHVQNGEIIIVNPMLYNQNISSTKGSSFKSNHIKRKEIYQQWGDKHYFQVSKYCKFYNKFRINESQVQKAISTDSYQLYSTQPLKKSISHFSFKLKKLKYGNLITGIIIEELLKNKESSCCVGCICFDNYYGVVLNNSIQDPTQYPKLKDEDNLTVVVDLQKRKIEWYVGYELLTFAQIPQSMLDVKLFPYFQLFDKGDCIVLNKLE